jgi:cytochrome P450
LAWRHARKGIAPAFSSKHISRMTDVVSEMMQEWIETRLESFAESGESFDVCKEMLNLTLRIITKSAFNYEISQEEIDQYLHDAPFMTKERIKWRIPLRRRMSMFIPAVREANECAKRLVSLSSKILQAYKESDTTLPGSCIDLIINNPNYKNDIHRCCDINVLIGAGHETSAYSVAWTLLELARNPSIQSDLNRVLKKESEQSGGQGDYSNVKELQNVVAESMRLNPVVGTGSVRVLARDIVVESKIEGEPDMLIPKGSSAFLTPYGRNRNANYYDQPDVFLPERWNDISIKNALKELMPFAVGRRDCVGQSLANAEIMTVLPKLLLDYNFTVVDEGRVENFVTMKPLGARLVAKKIS